MSSVFGKNGKGFLAQSRAALSFSLSLSLSITWQSLRKPVSCLLGFHTLVLSLSDVRLPLNYLSLIYCNGRGFLKTYSHATPQRNLADRRGCANMQNLWRSSLLRSDKCFSKSWQLETCCHEAVSAISCNFEQFPRSDLKRKKRIRRRDKLDNTLTLLSVGVEFQCCRNIHFKSNKSFPLCPLHVYQRWAN